MKKWQLLKTKNIFYSMLLFYAMDPKVTVGIVLTEKRGSETPPIWKFRPEKELINRTTLVCFHGVTMTDGL